MTEAFFNKGNEKGVFDKMLAENQQKTRNKRISQAEVALAQAKAEIDERVAKLNEILTFHQNKLSLYQELTSQHANKPNIALAEQITDLKKDIDYLEQKLEEKKPIEAVAAMQAKYEAIKAELEKKKAQKN